jgi:hypothetical protein
MTSATKEVVAREIRSGDDVALKVAPLHVKKGRLLPDPSNERMSADDVSSDDVSGLAITATMPSDVETSGILRRRLPEESINRFPADTQTTRERKAAMHRIILL